MRVLSDCIEARNQFVNFNSLLNLCTYILCVESYFTEAGE